MENNNSSSNKRVRDDFIDLEEVNSPEQKRIRVDSLGLETETHLSEQQHESSVVNLPVMNKQIEENLLHILDDTDTLLSVADDLPEIQGLDSFIRGFEEEILDLEHPAMKSEMVTSLAGEWQPEIGFLLEASDDELGIPPSVSTSGESYSTPFDLERFDDLGFGDALSFDHDLYAFATGGDFNDGGSEYVALGGLFDIESNDLCEFSYNLEPFLDN